MTSSRQVAALRYRSTSQLEETDYSLEYSDSVRRMLNTSKVSSRVIQQVLRTSNFNKSMILACSHKFAQLSDILKMIDTHKNLINKGNVNDDALMHIILDNLYDNRRQEINAYFKATYNIDTTGIPEFAISNFLGV
jgi:hypothetical protein